MADGDVRLRLIVDGIESIGGLRKAIKGTSKEIDALVLTTKDADKSLDALNKRHAELKNALTDLTKGGLSETQKQFRGAQAAMLDFTRVVQDSPYGIRGVANNLEMMTQSFLRLRTEAGGTGSAIGAMMSSMTGPAGILLGVSLVSALATAFGDKLIPKIETASDRMKTMVDNAKEMAKFGAAGLDKTQAEREIGIFGTAISKGETDLAATKTVRKPIFRGSTVIGYQDAIIPALDPAAYENLQKQIAIWREYVAERKRIVDAIDAQNAAENVASGSQYETGNYSSKTLAGSQSLDLRNRASNAYRRDNLGSLKDRDTWNFGPKPDKVDIPELKTQFTAFESSVISGTNAMAGVISNRLGKAFADVFGGAQTLLGGLVQAMTQALMDFASKWALGTLFTAIGGPLGGIGGGMLAGIGAMRMSNGLTGAAVGKTPTVRIDNSAGSFRVRGRDLVYVTDSSRRAMAGVSY